MKTISMEEFFLDERTCKYELCKNKFKPNRIDKVFCCRNCKNKNLKRLNYIRKKLKKV